MISRDPRALRVVTPFANAGIEGTEFLVRVDVDTTLVLVYEGSVKVENALGESTAGSGQSVLARSGSAPVLQQVVRPRDQVVWTLYYPPTGAGADPLVARAEEKLGVGRVAEAEADLAEALKQAPGSSDVLARQSVIALTRNDPTTAMALADQAVATTPGSVPARLAQSYVRQSGGDLPGAIATLRPPRLTTRLMPWCAPDSRSCIWRPATQSGARPVRRRRWRPIPRWAWPMRCWVLWSFRV